MGKQYNNLGMKEIQRKKEPKTKEIGKSFQVEEPHNYLPKFLTLPNHFSIPNHFRSHEISFIDLLLATNEPCNFQDLVLTQQKN